MNQVVQPPDPGVYLSGLSDDDGQSMAVLRALRPEQHSEWMDVLSRTTQYDFYYLPQYHALSEQHAHAKARLFVFVDEPYCIALPLLLRPVGGVPGLDTYGEGLWDATSVHGYSGPLASHADLPASVLHNFQVAVTGEFRRQNIVAVFSRLHPLIAQRGLLDGLGECRPVGRTVSIDLSLSLETQRARYRHDHKNAINRLRRLGVICCHDPDMAHLDTFVDIYHETMRRVGASEDYFFDRQYFETLVAALKPYIHLFVCKFDDEVTAAGLFVLCNGIVQFHLSGTRDAFLKMAPSKLLVDTARLWANERGAHTFHLGGGRAPLLEFKTGFSDRLHELADWHWVPLPERYAQLCQEKARWNTLSHLQPVSATFFPAYRCPTASP